MPSHTPSTSRIERPAPIPVSARTLVCLTCGDTTKHLRTLPKLGVRPKKLIFVCPSCNGVETKELASIRQDVA